ncbi:hypothetical protein PoMZ_03335 [Pyricularia oryzae]|uniref:Uncharacterized protein n=1 Tax=Pyricularia oryzae TaxID=318829 RepID=A0A4P7N7G0_PYROR|nr:hypothetical protein PoMZ_03335 [Pyricularia oryzae]
MVICLLNSKVDVKKKNNCKEIRNLKRSSKFGTIF